MSRHDKRLESLRRSRKNVRFDDLFAVLVGIGWVLTNDEGSHFRYEDPDNPEDFAIIVRPHGGHKTMRPQDVRKVLAIVERIAGGDDDGSSGTL